MSDLHPLSNGAPTAAPIETLVLNPISKRRRRPSVRLGDLGGRPAATPTDPHLRRSKQSKILSRPRPETLKSDENHDRGPLGDRIKKGTRDGKARRGRVRTNWGLKADETAAELRSSGGEEEEAGDEGYVEDSGSQSDWGDRRVVSRVRVSEANHTVAGDAPSETDNRDGINQSQPIGDGGVRSWLGRQGLGRYAPVFEIHEVDDEVLPLLTLEDLRDMGINAVGSRRKMYCAIQKLRKNMA